MMARIDLAYILSIAPAVLMGLLVGIVIMWRVMRRKRPPTTRPGRADAIFANVVAILGSLASADGIWWALVQLGITPLERAMFFGMLELGFVVALRRAARTLTETAADPTRKVSTGADGPAALCIILLSGLIAATAAPTMGGALIRMAFAAIAGWTWWGEISRQIATERARRRAAGLSATDPELDHDARYAARIRRKLTNAETGPRLKRWLLSPWRLWLRHRFDTLIDYSDIAIVGPMQLHLSKNYQAYEQTSRERIADVVRVWEEPFPDPSRKDHGKTSHPFPEGPREDLPPLPGRTTGRPPTPSRKDHGKTSPAPSHINGKPLPHLVSQSGKGSRIVVVDPARTPSRDDRWEALREQLRALPGYPNVGSVSGVARALGIRFDSAKTLMQQEGLSTGAHDNPSGQRNN